jgi:ribosome-binding protein aMBF1 (putative translation factor)
MTAIDHEGDENDAAYFNTLPDGTNFETKEDTSIQKRTHLESDERIMKGIIERGLSLNSLAKKIRNEPKLELKPEMTSTMPTISESEEQV